MSEFIGTKLTMNLGERSYDIIVKRGSLENLYQFARLDRRVAVVTGGGSGVGLAITRLLGERGCRVWIGSRSQQRVEQAAQQLRDEGLMVQAMACDVTSRDDVRPCVTPRCPTPDGSTSGSTTPAGRARSAPFWPRPKTTFWPPPTPSSEAPTTGRWRLSTR